MNQCKYYVCSEKYCTGRFTMSKSWNEFKKIGNAKFVYFDSNATPNKCGRLIDILNIANCPLATFTFQNNKMCIFFLLRRKQTTTKNANGQNGRLFIYYLLLSSFFFLFFFQTMKYAQNYCQLETCANRPRLSHTKWKTTTTTIILFFIVWPNSHNSHLNLVEPCDVCAHMYAQY